MSPHKDGWDIAAEIFGMVIGVIVMFFVVIVGFFICAPFAIIGGILEAERGKPKRKRKEKVDDLAWIDRIEEFDAFMN